MGTIVNEQHPTREGWLMAAAEELWPLIKRGGGVRNPTSISVGWPSRRPFMGKSGGRVLGQCWQPMEGKSSRNIFISPALEHAVGIPGKDGEPGKSGVLDTLLHELLHAALPADTGHKKPFARLAKAVGLEGKPTATYTGEQLKATLDDIAERLGPYPHERVDREGYRPQGTRMMKVVCPDCGYTLRTTRMWLETGVPTCPCGAPMTDDPDGQGNADDLIVTAAHIEYLTNDGRFAIRYSRDARARRKDAGKWTLTDLEHEDGPRVTVCEDKQDALDTADAIREGLFTFPSLEGADVPEDALSELEDDEDAEEWGSARASELDDFLGDDEEELHDYPEDNPLPELDPAVAELPEHVRFTQHAASEAEYERMTALREAAGSRKSEQIAAGVQLAMD